MKIFFKKIIPVIAILVLAVSMVGCSLFSVSQVDSSQSTEINETIQTENENNNIYIEKDLPSSQTNIDNVRVNPSTSSSIETREKMSLVDAVAKVKNACVAINISFDGSVYSASGTIVDISLDGDADNIFYVLTCHHVVNHTTESSTGTLDIAIYIPDADGKNYCDTGYDKENYMFTGTIGGAVNKDLAVSLVGGDQASDVAVLRLKIDNGEIAKKITKASILSYDKNVTLAEDVFAIGNPTGELPGTVSQGVISYLNRYTNISGIGNITLNQINLDIYSGSSGGGLFNMYGELVGITNSGNTEDIGINFAVPFKVTDDKSTDTGFYNVMTQLMATYSDTNYGYISGRKMLFGFTVTCSTNDVPVVYAVTSGGLAYNAGLREDDTIIGYTFNGATVNNPTYSQFTEIFSNLKIGEEITLTISRTVNTFRSTSTTTAQIKLTAYQYYFCNTQS